LGGRLFQRHEALIVVGVGLVSLACWLIALGALIGIVRILVWSSASVIAITILDNKAIPFLYEKQFPLK
jgi:hypothetical protein